MNNFGDGIRERKTPGIEIRGSRPGKKACPGPLICRQAVSRKIPTPRGLEEIGRKPLNVTPLEPTFLIFPKHGGILHSWSSFAITALIERIVRSTEEMAILLEVSLEFWAYYLFRRPSSNLMVS
jgi:hypothetical protein